MAIEVLERVDLASLERLGEIEIFLSGIKNQMSILRGDEFAICNVIAPRPLDPHSLVQLLDDEVSATSEDSSHLSTIRDGALSRAI
jgi:hypothetical protein